MAAISVKTDIDSDEYKLKKLITEDRVLDIVRRTIGNRNESIDVVDVRYVAASNHKLGFLGDYFKMAVDVRSGRKDIQLKYFVKSIPLNNEEQARFVRDYDFMKREGLGYDLAEKFQDVNCLAKCFLRTDSTLVLEDLHANGFEAANPRVYFTKEECEVALKAIANLHAKSLIYEEKQTKIRDKTYRLEEDYGDVFPESGFSMNAGWYRAGMLAMLEAVKRFSKYRDSVSEEKWFQLWSDVLVLGDPSSEDRNVLCHRDLWSSNLMFKYNHQRKPEKCVLVDLQALRLLPPAADVMSVLYLNLSRTDKDRWMPQLIQQYYEELRSIISDEGFNVEEMVPKDRFFKSCNDYRMFALMMVGTLLHLVTIGKLHKSKLFSDGEFYSRIMTTERTEFICDALSKDEDYRNRIIEYMEEMMELRTNLQTK